jgi:PBSX family phage portal protein
MGREKGSWFEKNKVGDDKVQAIITDRGSIVTEDMLKQYELPVSKSKQIKDVEWKPQIVEPPYSPAKLMNWMDIDTIHSACIHVKTHDAVGIGYYLEPPDPDMQDKEGDAQYKELMDFFSLVNPNEDLTMMLEKVFIDFEGCGCGYMEVTRNKDDKVNGLYHINATTMRWSKDKTKLIQKVGTKYVYFKIFGDDRILNKNTGNFVQGVRDVEDAANEVIVINQYSWRSVYYGLPEWLPSTYAMFGEMKEREYNIDFFLNFGVPAYAVILKGVSLNADVTEEIKKFFETTLKESNHKTLNLAVPKDGEVIFEPLNVQEKDASFRMYHKDNINTVLSAHRVPPYRVGIVIEGNLGGSVSKDTDRIYLDSVINPRQKKFAWVINELIIKRGFGIEGWTFQFEDINVADAKQDAEINKYYFDMGVLSPNEIRRQLGLDPYEGGDAVYISGMYIPVGLIGETPEEAKERLAREKEEEEALRGAGEEEYGEGEEKKGKKKDK